MASCYEGDLAIADAAEPVDFGAVMTRVHEAVQRIAPNDSAESLERSGVSVLRGNARFSDERTVLVDDQPIRFRRAIIATGARPRVLDVPGAESLDVLSSETLWEIRDRPGHLVVVGGGAIGCEIGQAMARLGSRVTVIQRAERLIPKESAKAEERIRAALAEDGVAVLTGRTAVRFASSDRLTGSVTLDDGAVVNFDRVLVAIGRGAASGSLGLQRANVRTDEEGQVVVNEALRTSNPRIWAAGDVRPLPRFTHTAGVNASIAASNAILGLSRHVDTRAVPRVTFTQPEVAAVGLQAVDTDPGRHRVVTVEHATLDRAVAESSTGGFTQVITDRRGVILGATIVGPRAGETLGEVALAVRHSLTASQVAGTMHAYPTFNDAFWNACISISGTRLRNGLTGRITRILASISRARLG